MKTYTPKVGNIQRKWHLIDAEGRVLGRLASEVAFILQGKPKTYYSPNVDVGDFVVIVNASGIRVTGDKLKRCPGCIRKIPPGPDQALIGSERG